MKLSISNIAWDKDQNEDVFNLIKQYKFSGIEIAPTKVFENPEKSTFDEVDLFRRLVSKHRLNSPDSRSQSTKSTKSATMDLVDSVESF